MEDQKRKYCSFRKFFVEKSDGNLILKDELLTVLGTAHCSQPATVARYDVYAYPFPLEAVDVTFAEMTVDEIVWHFLQLEEYVPW